MRSDCAADRVGDGPVDRNEIVVTVSRKLVAGQERVVQKDVALVAGEAIEAFKRVNVNVAAGPQLNYAPACTERDNPIRCLRSERAAQHIERRLTEPTCCADDS